MTEQHKGLILIIDESTDTFELIKKSLGQDYAYRHVQDSTSALSVCSLVSPDLLIINTTLSGNSGFEVHAKLCSGPASSKIPIIFLLDAPDSQQEITAFSHGAADVFIKPLVPGVVNARLRYCLAAKQQRDQQENLISLRNVELDIVNKRLVSLIEDRSQPENSDGDNAELAKSRFLANMSHEFRTPLNGIMGILQILRDSDIDPEQSNLLEMALESSENLLRMINELLELSKVETAGLPLNESSHRLRDELQPLNAIFCLQARWKGLEYHYSIAPSIPEKIIYDNSRLRHVVINLLDNALRFTEQGSIHFTVEQFTDETAANLGYVFTQTIRYPALLVSIADTGIGIPDKKLGTIFEKFDLGEDYITKKFSGSGIGLAIAKELISKMGGAIWVQSTLGVGSTFYVVVPYEIKEETIGELTPPTALDDHSFTKEEALQILIADADPVNQSVAAHFLQKFGHATTTVRDYDSTLEELRKAPFDVVLIDLQLPGLEGLDFVKRIRNNKEHGIDAQLPIVGVASLAFYGDPQTAMEAGINAVVSKPYQSASLIKAINSSIVPNNAAHQGS